MKKINEIAKELHYEYERQATYHKWNTQKECRVDFDDLPEQNKKVMLAIATLVHNREIDARIHENEWEIKLLASIIIKFTNQVNISKVQVLIDAKKKRIAELQKKKVRK